MRLLRSVLKLSIFDANSVVGTSMNSPYTVTPSEAIRRLRADLSPFLVHLTRSGTVKLWRDVIGRSSDEFLVIDAQESLQRIIRSSKIEAKSPFGYFNLKIPYRRSDGTSTNPGSRVQRSSLDVIPGSNICKDFAPMMPFFECFGQPLYSRSSIAKEIDFRWEREWRVVGDFEFSQVDVAFGLCPEEHISTFETLVSRKFLFVDPFWLKEQLLEKLCQDERLEKLLR